MKVRFVLAALLAALGSGCTLASDRYLLQSIKLDSLASTDGLVIVSDGAPRDCMILSMFIKVMEQGKKYHDPELVLLPMDGTFQASEFKDHHGHVFAVPLPAGNYYLTTWLAHPQYRAVTVPRADFSVAAGKVTYLGEFFMTKNCTVANEFEIRDQQERDFALIAKQNAAIAASDIDKQILTLRYVPAE